MSAVNDTLGKSGCFLNTIASILRIEDIKINNEEFNSKNLADLAKKSMVHRNKFIEK